MKKLLWLLLVAVISCNTRTSREFEAMTYVPVYAPEHSSKIISSAAARPTVRPGKIYAYGTYIFQVEVNEGIHVIDNSNPQQAKKISFLSVPGASELSIKSNYLYTNNVHDLVVVDISNIAQPVVKSRLAGAFPMIDQTFPPGTGIYYECPDPAKGIVVGWNQKMVMNPKCRR